MNESAKSQNQDLSSI